MTTTTIRTARTSLVLVRPVTIVAAGSAVLTGSVAAGRTPTFAVVCAAGSAALAVAAANVFNDVRDIEADRINRPERPLPSGGVDPTWAVGLAGVLSVAAMGLALVVGPWAGAWVAGLLLVAGAYSAVLQRFGLIGHAAVALLLANTVLFGAVVAGGTTAATWVGATEVAGVVLGREFLKSIPDTEGDRAVGARTAALRLGWRWSTRAFMIVNIGVLAIAAGAWRADVAPLAHVVVLAATVVIPSLVLGAWLLRGGPEGRVDSALSVTWCFWGTGLVGVALLALG